MEKIIITNFTDPVCVWCWATEPVFRAMETRYPSVQVRYVMGGLVRDLSDFEDPGNHISSRDGDLNPQIMEHWLQTIPRHHMPVEPEGFQLFTKETPSSYPQSIAYKAAQIASPDKADRYLRALRAASIAQARPTGRSEVLLDIAREADIDILPFADALSSGAAQKAFQTDLGLTQALGADVFPTFQVKSGTARQVWMRGFNTLQDFERVFAQLTDGDLSPLPSPPDSDILDWLLSRYGNQTPEEIYQAFDFDSRQQAEAWIDGLVQQGKYRKQPAGISYFLLPA